MSPIAVVLGNSIMTYSTGPSPISGLAFVGQGVCEPRAPAPVLQEASLVRRLPLFLTCRLLTAYACCDGASVAGGGVATGGAPAVERCASASRRRCSASSESDVRRTVPPYLLISGTTLSTVTLRTSTKIAELFGGIWAVRSLTKLSSMP